MAEKTRYVVFDLETNADRATVAEHEIIEIGACLVVDGTITDEWSTFARAERPLSPVVQELTGIGPEQLSNAPTLSEAIEGFLRFAGDLPLIAHNGIAYDFAVLDAACKRLGLEPPKGKRLDLLELAHVVYPRAGDGMPAGADDSMPPRGRQLSQLAEHLGIALPAELHRAVEDARLATSVLLRLLEVLDGGDALRELQRWILHTSCHAWSALLAAPPSEPPALESVLPPAPEWSPPQPTGVFDPSAAAAMLEPGGRVLSNGRTYRPQQAEMARAVAGALADHRKLMVEAPTGTGKTLAYLVPAVEYAGASGGPVVVATHSRVLQNQVLTSIADLENTLGRKIRTTLLKGRNNYINLDALEGEIEVLSDDPHTGLFLATAAGWVAESPTGEWDDLRTWAISSHHPSWPALRWRMTIDAAPGPARTEIERRCFYRRALRRMGDSEIVVLNHAVLLSRDDWHDETGQLILDEAHNLEESATAALSEEATAAGISDLLTSVRPRETRWGTIARFRDATNNSQPEETEAVLAATRDCTTSAASLNDALLSFVRDRAGARREQVERYGASYRLRRGIDTAHPGYRSVRTEAFALSNSLVQLADALNKLSVPAQVNRPYRRHRLESELARIGKTARELSRIITEVISCYEPESWIHICDLSIDNGEWSWGLRKAPLSVAPALQELWASLESVTLTSATLRIAGEWTFLIDRLGLEATETLALDSPFPNLHAQHLMVLPDHLPTPSGSLLGDFAVAEADEVVRLLMVSRGRALVLMTARSRLEIVRDHARPLLEMEHLPLMAQGDAPSPALQERMLSESETSLLALRSFWEGIDISGEALSLLVVEKLPFEAPDDPITAARMDELEQQGRDPFNDYLIPQAVLKLVQGVGRLIRSHSDIGASVILDKRLRRPVPYREQFLRSFPGPPAIIRPASAEEGYRAIAEHLGTTFDDDLLERLRSLPTSDPWRELDDLELTKEETRDATLVDERLERVRELFGFKSWRPGQLDIMRKVIHGEDVLAVLPTGSGKSLTFQIPALLLPGLTLVISPLIALMRDQVESLRGRRLGRVGAIFSGMPQTEQEEVLSSARRGHYKLLYVSPERLWSKRFRDGLKGVPIARVAVDEAHCISEWGHSFRPEYASIPQALKDIGKAQGRVPIVALTATATERVQKEIRELLGLSGSTVIGEPDRPELRYHIERCADFDDRDLRVLQVVEAFRGQPAIVYVPRRDDAMRIATLLRSGNHLARAYHGGMEPPQRIAVEEAFRYGELDVVVATKAFGLGIDKPDVALVLHLEMPSSVEEYIQEAGRCARGANDGTGPATGYCVLLSAPRDCGIHRQFTRHAAPTINLVKSVWERIATADRFFLPEKLAADATGSEDSVDAVGLAVHYLTQTGLVERGEDIMWSGRVWVPPDIEDVLASLRDPALVAKARPIIAGIRALGTEEYDAIGWSRRLEMDPEELEGLLLELYRRDIIGVSLWKAAWNLSPSRSRNPDWQAIEARCEERRNIVAELSRRARDYSRQDHRPRRQWLMDYLGSRGSFGFGCDLSESGAPPWHASTFTRDQVAESVPADAIVLALTRDIQGAGFSVKTIEYALAGVSGQYENRLAGHSGYGRLAILGLEGVRSHLANMETRCLIERKPVDKNGHQYETYVVGKRNEDS